MFIGREYELETLERLYRRPGFQFPVIYGRRRVGKTFLMAEFVRDKPVIFFTAVEDNAAVNLKNLSREIYRLQNPEGTPELAPLYSDMQTALEAIFSLATSRRLVFVIDEYPYLAKADSSVSSVLQALIDRNKEESQLYLMLCGSSLSFMREQVLGEKSPLYGRRTAQIELKPLDFFDALQFFPGMSAVDAMSLYGMVGGIPLYLKQFDEGLSLEENIELTFLDPSSILYEEPTNLLKQEVQKASAYNAVIGAIASGETENNKIALAAGVSPAELSYYLRELQKLGLVERELPVTGSGRRAVYRLSDNLFRFWYRFVLPNKPLVERHMTARVLSSITSRLPEYMGPVFEQICGEWLWRRNAAGELPASFDCLGRWWGNNPIKRQEEEIDVVCLEDKRPVILGECKWRGEPSGEAVARTLAERGLLIGADGQAHRYLFSKGGFTQGCCDMAEEDAKLHLVTLEDMVP